ncbi:MAG TPA: type I pullulanase [Firmicutes bacterium]|nr:type I pullulanase [Bacillota bacterium]
MNRGIFDFDEGFHQKYSYLGDLGALWTKEQTVFCLWAPTATSVELKLVNDQKCSYLPLTKFDQGLWQITIKGDLHGVHYNYLVRHKKNEYEVVDPYAKAVTINGAMGVVVDLSKTNPPRWFDIGIPKLNSFTEAIVYEVHVRDFSIAKNSGITNKGLFLGFTESNTVGPSGVLTGLSHLKELGVTHVQLLPIYDYATVDEKNPQAYYNWGYDPLNFNAVEGSYSSNPEDPICRIVELKKLILALRENGIRVIMDVVYNHTWQTETSNFNRLVPNYYYRMDKHGNFTNGSGCGNELATERFMVRKFIVDSMCYWAKEYSIKGFRIDLLGLYDIETVQIIRRELDKIDPSIIVYGEGWVGGPSALLDENKALKGQASKFAGIGVFNDDFRDAIKGNVFRDENKGFISGAYGMEESIKCGIVAASNHQEVDYTRVLYAHTPYTKEPHQSVNYAAAHDNLTLWDKLHKTNPRDSESLHIARQKLAGALVLLAQGVALIHAGQEFCRTKYGDHNSYRSGDKINQIDWGRKWYYRDVFKYYQGLIQLRKEHPAFRLQTAEEISSCLKFLSMPGPLLVGYLLKEYAGGDPWRKIVVLFNGSRTAKEIELPEDNWVIVVDASSAGVERIGRHREEKIILPRLCAMVLVDKSSFERSLKEG